MKKIIILVILFLFNIYSYANNQYFKTTRDSNIYSIRTEKIDDNYVKGIIKFGEKVISTNNFYWINDTNEKPVLVAELKYNGKDVLIKASDLSPIETSEKFDEGIISGLNNQRWIMSYYQEILKSKNIKNVFKYEPSWKDWKDPEGVNRQWTEDFKLAYGEFSFSNIAILIYHDDLINLIIRSIMIKRNIYYITVKKIDMINEKLFSLSFDWSRVKDKEFFNLILKTDGDYMDIYLEDEKTKLCELVKVNYDFMNAFYDVIDGKSPDLSNINWPQRASQSQTNNSTVTSTTKSDLKTKSLYQTTVNLRIRESSSTTAKIITTLPQGTKVEVLEKGKADAINGIKGNWVKVKTEKGETGWCFDGYLSH